MAGESKKARKHGRNFRTSTGNIGSISRYVASGGPRRMARRKAANHGCGLPAMHLGKPGERDAQHSGAR